MGEQIQKPEPDIATAVGSIDNIRADAGGKFTKATTDLAFVRGESLILRGWIATAIDAMTAAQRVRVVIDDTLDAQVESNIIRMDVAGALGAGNLLHAGFAAVLSTERLGAGRHTIRVLVRGAVGEPSVALPGQFAFEVFEKTGLIPDLPVAPRSRISGNIDTWTALPRIARDGNEEIDVYVRGWACDLELGMPVPAVYGIADRLHVVRGVTGFPRLDVASWLGSADYETCGFRLRMVLPATIANDGAIEVVVLAGDRAHRSTIETSKSMPRLPSFCARTVKLQDPPRINHSVYERAVLEDVLEFDRLRDERFGVNFA
jgi:hypothetical protein